MRILVTNDDGVDAPGLAALTRALVSRAATPAERGPARHGPEHDIVVVAPGSNYSGAGAAVGSVTDGMTLAYRRATIAGAESVAAYGLEASPALSVIVGALGAVGPKPDLVLSGINHGVNVGRSILHSGTVGAVLTASQLGISGLAVSLRSGTDPHPWDSAAELAVALIPLLATAPAGTALNLNVPHLPPGEIRDVRWARVSGAGLIKSAHGSGRRGRAAAPNLEEMEGPAAAEGARAVLAGTSAERGEIALSVGSPLPRTPELEEADDALGDGAEDVVLVANGFAALTALRGPRAEEDPEFVGQLDVELRRVRRHLSFPS